jgi:hypothetical protein
MDSQQKSTVECIWEEIENCNLQPQKQQFSGPLYFTYSESEAMVDEFINLEAFSTLHENVEFQFDRCQICGNLKPMGQTCVLKKSTHKKKRALDEISWLNQNSANMFLKTRKLSVQ